MMKSVFTVILSMMSYLVIGQVSISANAVKDSFEYGGVLEVTYKINIPANVTLTEINFESIKKIDNELYSEGSQFDKYIDVMLVDGGKFNIKENNLIVNSKSTPEGIPLEGTIKLSLLSIGKGALPIPELKYSPNVNQVPLQRNEFLVMPPNNEMPLDSLGNLVYKEYIKEEFNMSDVLDVLKLLLALGLAIFGIYYFVKKQKKRNEASLQDVEPIVVKRPAHIIAIEALDSLRDKQLWQNGETKAYHSELTRIMRQYLEDRYEIPALEMTTSQIGGAVSDLLDTDTKKSLLDILQIADIIKFAKGEAGQEINEKFLKESYEIVNKTKLLNIKPEEIDDGLSK